MLITVKKDKSVKIAFEARALNNEIVKDWYRNASLSTVG